MSSDLQHIAQRMRDLAADTGGTGREVAQAARDSSRLVQMAHAQGKAGLPVDRLVGQLQAAADRAASAAQAIDHLAQHGRSYADHLASAHYVNSGMSLGDTVGRALIGAQAMLGLVTAPVPDSYSTAIVDGEPVDAAQVVKDLGPHALDVADDQKDLKDALEEADSNKVERTDRGSGRPD